MKRKILLVLVTSIGLVSISFAQSKTTFGVSGGVNFQNLTGETSVGNDLDFKLKTGFTVGANVEIPVGIDFYLQPGLIYALKGAKTNDDNTKVNLSYLELPVNFIYKPAIGKGHLVMGFGPYAAYALSGKLKPDNGDDIDIEFENSITTAQSLNGITYAKRFDAGANLLFGYQWANNLSLQLNAGLGLVNVNSDIEGSDSNAKTKNTGFGVSVGYRF